ncbi:MAG: NUDIX domain-containing protein [Candidatus Melainabacteria bacterium]|nr:MAG: NUDIX domain-containing protein [Candidatus Melainabacteria bacterium]
MARSTADPSVKQTAGTLLYRFKKKNLEVLLVHPSGNYNKKSPWSIPKGLPDEGEDLEDAARRETEEETGVTPGDLETLGYVEYTKSRKRVHCFAGPSPKDAAPSCTSWEVDRAEFVVMEDAKKIIHPDQFPLLLRLEDLLNEERPRKSKK